LQSHSHIFKLSQVSYTVKLQGFPLSGLMFKTRCRYDFCGPFMNVVGIGPEVPWNATLESSMSKI
jgi:hypothetical protein